MNPTPSPDVAVEARGVRKFFGANEVIRGIDFVVPRGARVAVIGPSGSGKSTLCRLLIGLERPDEGELLVGGERFLSRPDRRSKVEVGPNFRALRLRLGMVFQHFTLFPQLTVLDNVTLAPRKVLGIDRSVADERAVELLQHVGLADKVGSYPAHLSGGQKQRAAIARALAMQPEVMFFDEVTSALDPELVHEVLLTIRQLANDGMTLVVVTHEMAFARQVASEVVFMDQGVIVERGSPAAVFGSPKHARTASFLDKVLSHDPSPSGSP